MVDPYRDEHPGRAEVDASVGALVLEFGNDWCGHCTAVQPLLAEAFAGHGDIARLKLADAREKRLGRSFGVKLWPTLVFLRDGRELARVVRPRSVREVADALAEIAEPPAGASPAGGPRGPATG